jgi:hypothetical protein
MKETLTEVRSRYWILQGRTLIRQVVHRCVICRKLERLPYRAPSIPTLPIQEAPRFSHVGVDFAGHPHIKLNKQYTENDKVYICHFTCCVTQAVHLELVADTYPLKHLSCASKHSCLVEVYHRESSLIMAKCLRQQPRFSINYVS